MKRNCIRSTRLTIESMYAFAGIKFHIIKMQHDIS
jgi:hypothetical protein